MYVTTTSYNTTRVTTTCVDITCHVITTTCPMYVTATCVTTPFSITTRPQIFLPIISPHLRSVVEENKRRGNKQGSKGMDEDINLGWAELQEVGD